MSVTGTTLITGLRGNGKTLRAVQMMQEEIAAGRLVYASNFDGLTLPGVIPLDDPRQWQDLPAGSVLFVDEAQRYWRSRRSGEAAPEVIAMETQRHDGVSMVLLTQQPTYLDKHVRGLVDQHQHLIRRAGFEASQSYVWERCKDEPESPANVDLSEKSVWMFPKALYGLYASAEVHTIKRRIPARAVMILAAVVLVPGALWWAVHGLGSDPAPGDATVAVPAVSGEADTAGRSTVVRGRDRGLTYATAADYVAALNPRVQEIAWTAPAWDGREVTSDPHVYCVASGHDGMDGCLCLTEQGTRFGMDNDKCISTARYGEPYNPFKAPQESRRGSQQRGQGGRGAGDAPAAMGEPVGSPAPVGASSLAAGDVQKYGGISID